LGQGDAATQGYEAASFGSGFFVAKAQLKAVCRLSGFIYAQAVALVEDFIWVNE
jgi:hypothetical protein